MFKLISSFIVFLLLLSVQPASAFVPDDEELAVLLQKNYGPLTSWEAEMRFPRYPGVSVNLWYARGKWRQQWVAGDKAEGVGMAGSVIAACTAGDFALSPMFVWMVPNPLKTWSTWGIDSANKNYGFCGDQPCFIIGGEPGDDMSSTVHLNNEDMSPIRVRYLVDGTLISVDYTEYKTLGGFRVPQKVAVSVGEQSLEATVRWKAVMKAEGEELYSRDSISTPVCAEPPAPFDFLRETFRYPSQ